MGQLLQVREIHTLLSATLVLFCTCTNPWVSICLSVSLFGFRLILPFCPPSFPAAVIGTRLHLAVALCCLSMAFCLLFMKWWGVGGTHRQYGQHGCIHPVLQDRQRLPSTGQQVGFPPLMFLKPPETPWILCIYRTWKIACAYVVGFSMMSC